MVKNFQFWAKIIDWYDGDTFHATIDRGWNDWKGTAEKPIRVRISNVKADEMNMPGGPPARDFANSLAPPGTEVELISQKLDQYGRPLGLVYLADGRDLGKLIIEGGHATPYNALKE